MARTSKLSTTCYLPDTAADVTVVGTYYPGTKDYFDKSFGNWLPGDPPEIDVDSIRLDGAELAWEQLSERDREQAADALALAAAERDEP